MFTSILSAFAIASLASAAVVPVQERSHPIAKRDGATCNIDNAVGPFFIGGGGGGAFCESHYPSGDLITSITTYSYATNDICGIKIKYASGATAQHGGFDNVDQSGHFDLAPGERITRASMAGNGKGTMLGKIYIETSKGGKYNLGNSGAQMHDIDVGTGMLIGITGHSGSEINNMALVFLAGQVDRITIDNFQFKDDPTKQPVVSSALAKTHYYNADNSDLPVEFNGGTKVTTTHTFTQTTTLSFGDEIKVEAKVSFPEVAEVSVSNTFKFSVDSTTTNTLTISKEVDQGFALKPTLKPKEGVDCQALVGNGKGDFDYTSTVTVYMKDGGKFWYPETGTLKSEAFSSTDARCTQNNNSQAPDGFQQGKTH